MFNLPAISSLADETDPLDTTLSPFSVNLILAAIDLLYDLSLWSGADEINGLTDAEKDEIEEHISRLAQEVLT